MHTAHLNWALQVISNCIALATAITLRMFHTLFAFKGVLEGSIPAWRLAAHMWHFSGHRNLSQKIYAPTHGPIDTRRTAASAGAALAFSNSIQNVLNTNGVVMHLPHPDNVNANALQRACLLLETMHQQLEERVPGNTKDIPTNLKDAMADTFCSINNSVCLPFKEFLAGLLSITSTKAVLWASVVEQGHLFKNKAIHQGLDQVDPQWSFASLPSLQQLLPPGQDLQQQCQAAEQGV